MNDQHAPAPSAIEVLLFAPLGALLLLRERAPEWAVVGRQRTETRIRVARMVGEFAVRTGVKEVERFIAGRRSDSPVSADSTATTAPETTATTTAVADTGAAPGAGAASVVWSESKSATTDADALPIPAYDSLAASQVVERLAGLSSGDLEAVRAYEAAGRHRQTVLHRIDQLLAT
jgi:hypothetical protein